VELQLQLIDTMDPGREQAARDTMDPGREEAELQLQLRDTVRGLAL
jgi:hypothetical protein